MTTAVILTIYILGSSIPIPLGDTVAEAKSNYIMQLTSSATGGNLTKLMLMSMGLGPYMVVMILWSVLAMIKPLGLGNLSEKESGYVRNLITLVVSIIQAIGIVMNFDLKLDLMYKAGIIDERVTLGDRDILADYEDKQRVLDEMMITEIMNFNVAAVRDLCSQVMNNEYNAAMGKLSESWKPKLDKLRSELAD
ncbi:hypothetical protein [Ligilactobacillus salivarius]|uniref:Uncharacterized protein n=2 Tax=Ligilactobacillus salivarius TaxID=1624 RepID=A0A1V9R100_9LACO|nr:hypothetical protein [Ligilactobacillus salivarius]OQQ86785.1 hypothetical protein B6U60_00325 [Ligilactobacillus salivarius]OQQ89577.1 hypothetical protein B6U59_00440 [Ligilactobacillus salivarius]